MDLKNSIYTSSGHQINNICINGHVCINQSVAACQSFPCRNLSFCNSFLLKVTIVKFHIADLDCSLFLCSKITSHFCDFSAFYFKLRQLRFKLIFKTALRPLALADFFPPFLFLFSHFCIISRGRFRRGVNSLLLPLSAFFLSAILPMQYFIIFRMPHKNFCFGSTKTFR